VILSQYNWLKCPCWFSQKERTNNYRSSSYSFIIIIIIFFIISIIKLHVYIVIMWSILNLMASNTVHRIPTICLIHWEKSWENYRENSLFPEMFPFFFSKWTNYSPILRKNWNILGNIQNFPKMFPWFLPVEVALCLLYHRMGNRMDYGVKLVSAFHLT